MRKSYHRIYIFFLAAIIVISTVALIFVEYSYFNTDLSERFFHPDHTQLKPNGFIGHGLGIIGSLCLLVGIFGYMARKRFRFLMNIGVLKHWLEFHIFLCILGPILITFHTTLKFGGLVSISYWSMVLVLLSGIAGRYIYLQIPRNIQGAELSLGELNNKKSEINAELREKFNLEDKIFTAIQLSIKSRPGKSGNLITRTIEKLRYDKNTTKKLLKVLSNQNLTKENSKRIIHLVKKEIDLYRKMDRLATMQNLFKFWHVIHLPLALVMLIIMFIHVGIAITFGYTWIL
ncbi:MAG: hypothetical protein PF486_04200 [Prolixibacteraceae bacterium]|jgi:hypothetical protein|nr:hypothetical protein [Prolixibacteraceae bacterium]